MRVHLSQSQKTQTHTNSCKLLYGAYIRKNEPTKEAQHGLVGEGGKLGASYCCSTEFCCCEFLQNFSNIISSLTHPRTELLKLSLGSPSTCTYLQAYIYIYIYQSEQEGQHVACALIVYAAIGTVSLSHIGMKSGTMPNQCGCSGW